PAAVGQVIALVRTVHTSQLLVMREPLVELASAPLVGVRPRPGVKAYVVAGPLERVLMSYILRNHSKPHLTVCLPAMFCMWALISYRLRSWFEYSPNPGPRT